jgi:hypothetical protein
MASQQQQDGRSGAGSALLTVVAILVLFGVFRSALESYMAAHPAVDQAAAEVYQSAKESAGQPGNGMQVNLVGLAVVLVVLVGVIRTVEALITPAKIEPLRLKVEPNEAPHVHYHGAKKQRVKVIRLRNGPDRNIDQ